MKKRILFLLLVLVFSSSSVYAQSNVNIYIDGNKKVFNPPPIIDNGSTLVPLRQLFETFGAKVDWYDQTKTVVASKESIKIQLQINSYYANINGKKTLLPIAPKLINEKTYIPLRVVSEGFGLDIYWNDTNKSIYINKRSPVNYTLVDSQKYSLRQTIDIVSAGEFADVEFDILLGCSSNSPYQKDEEITISPEPDEVYYDNYGNKFGKIKVEKFKQNEKMQIMVTKKLQNSGINYNINENSVPSDYGSEYNLFINPEEKIESKNPDIIKKALELSQGVKNPYLIAKKVFEFVNLNIIYDESSIYARKGAVSALSTKRGVCEDFSELFVALMRANNIPTRSVIGISLQGKDKSNLSYDSWTDITNLGHEWPEFYIKNYGWIICEPTFSYTINKQKVVPWNQFANQNESGHIIYNYHSNEDKYISWRGRGYGDLNINYKNEIKKER